MAVIVRDEPRRAAVLEHLAGRLVLDLSEQSPARALLALAARPAGLTVVGSRREAALLRAGGMRVACAQDVLDEPELR